MNKVKIFNSLFDGWLEIDINRFGKTHEIISASIHYSEQEHNYTAIVVYKDNVNNKE